VLENITGPVYEYRCGNVFKIPPDPICAINPLCCTPQVCKVTPACGIARVITDTIAQAGNVHCFEGISAGDLWQRWKDRQIAFVADGLTGGVAEVLLPLIKAGINSIALGAPHLPKHLQELLKDIITPVYDHGNMGFGHDDIRDIKIIREDRTFNTDLWLPDGKDAITLGSVIIVNDADYRRLMAPANNYTLTELLMGHGTLEYANAVGLMIHELVHVKQYRVLGTDTFILNYLMKNAPLVTSGYGHDAYEREAYNFEADMLELHGGVLCERTAPNQEKKNSAFNLGRDSIECQPYIAWMIPILSP
jgi:hypothetical protein